MQNEYIVPHPTEGTWAHILLIPGSPYHRGACGKNFTSATATLTEVRPQRTLCPMCISAARDTFHERQGDSIRYTDETGHVIYGSGVDWGNYKAPATAENLKAFRAYLLSQLAVCDEAALKEE